MKREFAAILLATLVVLAGCYDDGDDSDTGVTVEKIYDESLEHIGPNEGARVEAKVTGETNGGEVYLTYEVTTPTGEQKDEKYDRITMEPASDGSNRYVAKKRIPEQAPGAKVSVTVHADDGDGDTDRYVDDYKVSYLKSVSDPGTSSTEATPITVTLWSTDDAVATAKEVRISYEIHEPNTGPNEGIVRQGEVTESVDSSELTLAIPSPDNPAYETYHVNYTVTVAYGDENTTMTYDHPEQSYTYTTQQDHRVLYVPVVPPTGDLEGSPITPSLSTLKTYASKMEAYYYQESDGAVDIKSAWETPTNSDRSYHRLSGSSVNRYVDRNGEKLEEYDAQQVLCDVYENILTDEQVDQHTTIVVVFAGLPNQTDGGGPNLGKAGGVSKSSPGDSIEGCSWGTDGTEATDYYTGNVQISTLATTYSTWAHEFGHAEFGWPDYYGPFGNGHLKRWGLMGRGIYRPDHPSQITVYHKQLRGWASVEEVSASEVERRGSIQRTLGYQHEDGKGLNVSIVGERERSIFDAYMIAARDPRGVDHVPEAERDDGLLDYDEELYGPGLVVYGLRSSPPDGVQYTPLDAELVKSMTINGYGAATLMPAAYGEPVLKDPDAGIQLEYVGADSDSATVNVTQYDPESLQGVNIYVQVNCSRLETSSEGTAGDCSELQAPQTPNGTRLVSLRAVTDEGVVGLTENGTVVNDANGTVLVAGSAQKVYVDANRSVRFVVDSSEALEATNATLNLTTQTVVRTENGTRVASELDTRTVEPGAEVEPELARLELNRSRWDAGQHRTLRGTDTAVTIRNTGIEPLDNVTVATDSSWLTVNGTTLGALESASNATLGVALEVPGGAPVGNYTFNLTVAANGTSGRQTRTVQVTVDVLPTVRWNVSPARVDRDLARTNTTRLNVTVTVDGSSNVPLRDVVTTVSGNVTAFDVTPAASVATVDPGESVVLTSTVDVPTDGIDEGVYDGLVRLDTMQRYQRYYDYPVDVPDEYVVPDDESHETNVTVEAHGPSVNSTATLEPERQVAMRKGSTTLTATVQPVEERFDVPAGTVRVRTETPDGWHLQGDNLSAHLSVWVRETNAAGKLGPRTRLAPANFTVDRLDGAFVVTIPDVRETAYGAFLTPDERLAFEVTLNKDKRASNYSYDAKVDARTRSPWAIYRSERAVAAIDVFDPRPGTEQSPVADPVDRVPGHAVRADHNGTGTNGTLTAPRTLTMEVDGGETHWLVMDLSTESRRDDRVVWVRLDGPNGTFDGTVNDDGYLVVQAYATPSVHVGAVSGMDAATNVTIQLPSDANLTAGTSITVDDYRPTGVGANTSVVFRTPSDRPAASVDATVRDADDGTTIEVPVVVGRQLAAPGDPGNESTGASTAT